MGSSLVKASGFPNEVIRFCYLDHGLQETALAVFALEVALISRERNGGVTAPQVFIADHAGQVKGDLCPVDRPGLLKRLFEEAFIL